MANHISFFFGYRDMDCLEEATSTSQAAADTFEDRKKFQASNFRSTLTEEEVEKFPAKYKIPTGAYRAASPSDRVYHNIKVAEYKGGVGTSISEAAFKCGFRVPRLPILKNSSTTWELLWDRWTRTALFT